MIPITFDILFGLLNTGVAVWVDNMYLLAPEVDWQDGYLDLSAEDEAGLFYPAVLGQENTSNIQIMADGTVELDYCYPELHEGYDRAEDDLNPSRCAEWDPERVVKTTLRLELLQKRDLWSEFNDYV
jgi:hypothetical protein